MCTVMDEKEMRALARQLAKSIKTEKDLSDFSRQLKKKTVEAGLGAEIEAHFGYANMPATAIIQATAVIVQQ